MTNKNMYPLICILGRSGSGKSTLADALCRVFGLEQVKSYTTRPMRPGEEVKSDHIFITKDDVEKYRSDIIAYTKIGDYEYFATHNVIYQSDIYVIDPIGVSSLRKNIKYRHIYEIYVCADGKASADHLTARQDKAEDMTARSMSEKAQFDAYELLQPWDFKIDNSGELKDAVNAICKAYQTIWEEDVYDAGEPYEPFARLNFWEEYCSSLKRRET